MEFPDFLDYLIVDELVSEDERDAERRRREECGSDPDDRDDGGRDDRISDYDD